MKPIFLLGFMASGKTTLGKKIAKRLNFEFIDIDTYIEEKKKILIEEIFSSGNENIFREYEKEAVLEIINKQNCIVSTGGGTPCYNNLIDIINKNCISIYIKLSYGMLVHRIKNSHKIRPLVKNLNDIELQAYVLKTLAYREKYYSQATHIIGGKSVNLDSIIDKYILNDKGI